MKAGISVIGLGYVGASELVGEQITRGTIDVFDRRAFID
jgi:hypothetical protein